MAKATKKQKTSSIMLEIPVAEVQEVSFGIHIDGDLTPRQSNALRRIAQGLNGKLGIYATATGNIKYIHAIRFLLEAVAERMDADNPDEARMSGSN